MRFPKRKTSNRIARALDGRLGGVRGTAAAAAGVVAAAAAGVAASRLLRNHESATVLHVQTDSEDGWMLTEDGTADPIDRFPRKRQAVTAAREFAREHAPAVLNIHRTDGSVLRTHAYGTD